MQFDIFKVYARLVGERQPIPRTLRVVVYRLLDDVPVNCGTEFRFRTRAQLRRVMFSLDLPAHLGPFPNGQCCEREWGFLFFMRRMASVNTVLSLMEQFGGDPGKWSRVIKWLSEYIANKFRCKMEAKGLEFFQTRFGLYSESIRQKANEKGAEMNGANSAPLFPQPDDMAVMGFVDGKFTATCVPGSGPMGLGAGAPRRPAADMIQQAFYTGWLCRHGIKHLTLDAPDGMTMFCYGPSSIRHNDLTLLHDSGIDREIGVVEYAQGRLLPMHRLMYGDAIFPWRNHLRSRHNASVADARKVWKDDCDESLSSARMLVENHYAQANMLFPFMSYEPKLKVLNMNLAALYTVKVLFRNMHVCMNENLTSQRFNCVPPTLEGYMA